MFRSFGLMLAVLTLPAAGTEIMLTNFSQDDLSSWTTKSFSGRTRYRIIAIDNLSILKADSEDSASGLWLDRKIDLLKTPFINWSWSIENRLQGLDERSKSGDDYAARIYVVIKGGWAMWQTKAMNYVWSSNQKEGAEWDNAYVGDKVRMIAVRGREAKLNHWYFEKRNVYRDLIAAYGDKGSEEKNLEAYRYIDSIAIMTDTDDSHQKAVSYYGDIIFSKQ